MSNTSWSKNKKIDLRFYIDTAISLDCELPIAIDEQNVKLRIDGTVGTLSTDGSSPKKNNRIMEVDKLNKIRIRKITPRECFRLMGFTADDYKKVSASSICDTQIYKQAGNSIVVNVLEAIFTSLGERYEEFSV